jgi:uncharacterized protein YfaS (alpha-2-macroglobulin family)
MPLLRRALPSPSPARLRAWRLAAGLLALAFAWSPGTLVAQDSGAGDTQPAFSLASEEIFDPGAKEPPRVEVVFQRLSHLDFRVYRVRDTAAFFAGLREAHFLGSPEYGVAQQPTLIERIAAWKARWRARVTDFFRQQVSWEYREDRRARAAQDTIVRRRTVKYTQFAQVPLLNPDQVVATWRELLPNTRSADSRTIPLELADPGVYVVEAVNGHLRAFTLVVLSKLALVTKTAPGQVLLFAVDRRTGEPRGDCATAVIANQQTLAAGTTSAQGVFTAEVQGQQADDLIALARCGDDTVVADPGGYFLRAEKRSLKAYIYTDRPIYRPGHDVHLKAVLRWNERGLPIAFDRQQVEFVLTDPDEKVVLRQQRPVDTFGAAFTSVKLPADAALGDYTITVNSEDSDASGSFEVQEYRKPEFEVSVGTPQKFYLQGTTARVTVRARYYFGQPVAHGRVTLVTYSSGYWSPWKYIRSDEEEGESGEPGYYGDEEGQVEAELDANGEAVIDLDVPESERAADLTLRLEARVTDATEREVSGRTSIVATAGPWVIAVDTGRYVQAPGSAVTFRIRVVDHTGKPQAGVPVALALGNYRYTYTETTPFTPLATGAVTTAADGFASWSTTVPAQPGTYRVEARAMSGGRAVVGERNFWVPGPGERAYDEDRSIELVPEKNTFQPGDTATFLVRGLTDPATLLITKEHAVTGWHAVQGVGPGGTIQVPITGEDVGDVWVNVAFVRDDNLYVAERRVRVPPLDRRLQVTVVPAQNVSRPREPGVFTVQTLDAAGTPVSAQVSVGVVDEAVYGVKPDGTADPVSFFYRRHYASVSTGFSRTYSFTGYSGTQQLKLAQRRRPLSLADFKAERPERPKVRKDFPDAIFWVADLVTDATGTATVKVAYPDSLTTWRVTARAVTPDTRLGAAVARTTTTKDVIVRVATPRFLTEGDTVSVPVVAHNYLAEAKRFSVSLTAAGVTAAPTTPSAPVQADIPAQGEHRSSWTFAATTVGPAAFTGEAAAGADADAAQMTIPVLPFGLARETGVSGTLPGTSERTVTLEIPEPSNPAARSIELSLAPSMAGTMLSAVDFLTGYPYGCTEQTLSSFLPNLLVMRTLSSLKIAPAERAALAARFAAAGLQRLQDYQHEDGGFGWWKTDDNHPFMTAYALYGYLEARRAGLFDADYPIRRAAGSAAEQYRQYPRMVPDLKAYIAFVLARTQAESLEIGLDGDGWDAAAIRDELWNARDELGAHGRALLLMTLDLGKDARAATLAQEIVAAAQTRGDLSWWTAERDPLLEDYADTSVEATALSVQALAPRDPGNPVLERAVRWLLANRGNGSYWFSTKQTAYALYGLLAFLEARKETPAAFSVDVYVNGEKAGTRDFTPESFVSSDPLKMSVTAKAGRNEVRLVKRGGGVLYWTAKARYYDTRQAYTQEGSRKLAISREYFALTPVQTTGRNVRTVYRGTPFAGTATPGDLILVRLTVAGAADWRYLVIEDPIPAGTEAVSNQDAYELERSEAWWRFGRGRREYRDAQVVQFQDRLPSGRADFAYLLKVVTPGTFRAMPAQVLPMYVPGVSASTTLQQVTVSDRAVTPEPSAPSESEKGASR